MDRIWLKSYPAGVPGDVDVSRYASLVALLEESFEKYRRRNAYVCMGRFLTYAELDEMSRALAGYLQSLGLARGDRVALMMPNVLQYPIAAAAVLRAGYIAVNVNPMYTPRELEHQLKDSGAVAIVILENFATTLAQVIAATPVRYVVLAAVGDLLGFPKGAITNFVVRKVKKAVPPYSLPGAVPFNTALADGRRTGFQRVEITPDDIAVLQYTGGTTGVAKGAVLLHRTLVGALLSSDAWTQPGLKRKPIGEQLTIVCALPLYHVFAFVTCALLGMRVGGMNILIVNPRDIKGMIEELANYRINVFPAVNTLFNALANQPAFASLDFSQLVISNGGGSAVQEVVAKKWLAIRLPDRGRLRPVRDLVGRDLQPHRYRCVHRHDRPAVARRRGTHPGRCRSRRAARRAGRDRDPRRAGDGRLLAAAGRHRTGHDGQRLFQNWRHRRDGRRRSRTKRRF